MKDVTVATKLRLLATTKDPESAHGAADELLCKLLLELGYKQTVAAFLKMTRWYA